MRLPSKDKTKAQPRTDSRQSKLRALTPEQTAALLRWLDRDNVTYQTAKERLKKKFGVSLSSASMSVFWHRHHQPLPAAASGSKIVIELLIHSTQPIRLIAKKTKC